MVAIIAVVAAWRLSEGPVSIGYLLPYVKDGLGELPGGLAADAADAVVVWDGAEHELEFRAVDVTLTNRDGIQVLTVPAAALDFDGESLLRGQLRPSRIATRGLNLLLRRNSDGSLAVGLVEEEDAPPPAGADTRPVPAILDELFRAGPRNDGTLSRLQSLVLRDSRILLNDAERERFFLLLGREVRIAGNERAVSVNGDLALNVRRLHLPFLADLRFDRRTQAIDARLTLSSFRPPELIAAVNAPPMLDHFQFPLAGVIDVRLDGDGRFGPINFDLTTGEGQFAMPGELPAPVPIVRASASGSFDADRRRLSISSLDYDAGTFKARGRGTVTFEDAGPDLDFVIEGTDLPAVLVPAYWPVNRAAEPREWIERHVLGGRLDDVRAHLDFRPEEWGAPPRDEALDVEFTFRDAAVRLYPPYDDIRDATGRGRITGQRFDLELQQASHAGLKISDGKLSIAPLEGENPQLDAEFVSEGGIAETVGAVLRGKAAERLGGGLDLEGLRGEAAARVRLRLPIGPSVKLDDLDVGAAANLTDVAVDRLYGSYRLRADQLSLRVDLAGMEVWGPARINDVAFETRWIESFAPKPEYRRHLAFGGRLTPADLAKFGLEVPEAIDGAATLQADLHFRDSGAIAGSFSGDLGETAIRLPDLGWSKQSGSAGRIAFDLFVEPDKRFRVVRAALSAPELSVAGRAEGSIGQGLTTIELPVLQLKETDLSGRAERTGEETWRVTVGGRQLDLRNWTEGDSTLDAQVLPNARVDWEIERLLATAELAVDRATGALTIADGRLDQLAGRGMLEGEAPFEFELASGDNGRTLEVTSADAGLLLRSGRITPSIRGGTFELEAELPDRGPITGLVTVKDYRLAETPAFARLLSLASLTGIGQALSGEGLAFTVAEVPFAYENGQLDVADARMAGALGITANGFYRPKTEELRLVGNLIPAYSISRVLGQIPLLGPILGGDEGIFGVTYLVEGNASDPQISANPLSALAPGILRRMFLAPVDPEKVPKTRPVPLNDR